MQQYFINESKNKIISIEGEKVEEFLPLAFAGGGQLIKEVKKYKIRKANDDLDDLIMPKEKVKRKVLSPETINKIKEELNLGTSVNDVAKKFNVGYNNVYSFKKTMEERAKDTLAEK